MNRNDMAAAYAASTAIRNDRYQRFLRARLRAVNAVIVDLDGTMVDTAPDFHAAVLQLCAERAMAPWTLTQVSECIGKGPENLVRQVLASARAEHAQAEPNPDADADADADFALALASFERHYAAVNGVHARLYDGVVAGLEAMQEAGLLLACVTNKPHALALELLRKKALLPYFRYVYGGDSLPFRKPHAYPVLRVCSDFALMPDQAALIGDSSNDVQAAQAAGTLSLCVPYGYNHGRPIASAGADAVVDDLVAAAQLILS